MNRQTMDDQELPRTAERCRQLRVASGAKNRVAFCRRYGIDNSQWSSYEKGSARPSLMNARRLKAHLGVTLDWIYDGDVTAVDPDLLTKLAEVRI